MSTSVVGDTDFGDADFGDVDSTATGQYWMETWIK
jgi:hypothetical protein